MVSTYSNGSNSKDLKVFVGRRCHRQHIIPDSSYNRESTAGMNAALLSMSIVDFIILWTFPKLWRIIFLLSNEFCFQWLSQPQLL